MYHGQPPREIKDAPIANTVNPDSVRDRLMTDNFVSLFAKEGAKLLEQTNKPNIITLAQFTPFIPLFNMDVERYQAERPSGPYYLEINKLYNNFIRGLEINLYEPTFVIQSKEDPKPVYFLNRRFTRIASDHVAGRGLRDTVPAAVSKAASVTRDQLLLDASVADLVSANNTPEQRQMFARIRMESALIEKNFVERNLPPEKKSQLVGALGEQSAKGDAPASSSEAPPMVIFDDED